VKPAALPLPSGEADTHTADVEIAIVGAGFAGIGAAIRLRQAGFHDFLVFEQADDVGGTWRDNTYPGCACDVPSHLYCFSFAPNPDWSDTFSGQREIWAYLRGCVERFGLGPRLRLGHAVQELAWDDAAHRWQVRTPRGTFTARAVIAGTGPLSQPAIPDLPGLASFQGVAFHSARWRHDRPLAGRRVAVVGTGASAVQLIPEIAPTVASLAVFQRTPAWVVPRRSRPITPLERRVYRSVPGAQRLVRTALYWGRDALAVGFLHPRVNRLVQRLAAEHLRRQVPDPRLRAALTPSYVLGCKRVLLSNDYYPALQRDNVTLVTDPIREVVADGIVTADGRRHQADTIIFSTGFHVTDTPVKDHIRGRGGRLLADSWAPTMHAHLGTMVSGFPNLFLLLGPNTGLGHTSVVLMIESQLAQVVAALRRLRRSGAAAIEPAAEAQRRHSAWVDARMAGTVWTAGGCASWYLDATGRNSTLWPGFATGYRLRLRHFRPGDYLLTSAAAPAPRLATGGEIPRLNSGDGRILGRPPSV
jgi:cation diffusion facilitator CzcD-associated flavoprotein CzcO